tara:strand:+ start:537 stop:812 length:276 start_codon:yes stop_codon:yes gene_type:complete
MSLKVTKNFGKLTAEELSVGELVYWYNWNPGNYEFERNYGILTGTKEVEYGGRLVSMAEIVTLAPANKKVDIFVMHLHKTKEEPEVKDVDC